MAIKLGLFCFVFLFLFHSRPLEEVLPLHHRVPEPDQKDRPAGPHLRALIVRRDLGLEAAAVADALDDARDKGGAVEHAHLLGHADVGVDERVVVRDHVLVWRLRGDGVLEGVGRPVEEQTPERAVDEMQQREDTEGSVWRGG